MGRKYWAGYTGTLTNAGGNSDLIEILPADDKPVRLLAVVISQISEVADAAEEGLQLSLHRMAATITSGSGGSSVTPVPVDSSDVAFGGTVECNNTTVATTSGADNILGYLGWNVRNTPFDFWLPEPDVAPKAKQGEGLFLRCDTTPADDITINLMFLLDEE